MRFGPGSGPVSSVLASISAQIGELTDSNRTTGRTVTNDLQTIVQAKDQKSWLYLKPVEVVSRRNSTGFDWSGSAVTFAVNPTELMQQLRVTSAAQVCCSD